MQATGKWKFVLIGDKNVGKRSLLTFGFGKSERYSKLYVPIEFVEIDLRTPTKRYDILVYDSLVTESWLSKNDTSLVKPFTHAVLNGADAALLCYSANNEASFRSVKEWYKNVSVYFTPKTHIYLVETKADLQNKINQSDRDDFLNNFKFEKVFRVSAYRKDEVVNMFTNISERIDASGSALFTSKISLKDSYQSPEKKQQPISIIPAKDIRYSDKKERIIISEGSYVKKMTVTDATASQRLEPKKLQEETGGEEKEDEDL